MTQTFHVFCPVWVKFGVGNHYVQPLTSFQFHKICTVPARVIFAAKIKFYTFSRILGSVWCWKITACEFCQNQRSKTYALQFSHLLFHFGENLLIILSHMAVKLSWVCENRHLEVRTFLVGANLNTFSRVK